MSNYCDSCHYDSKQKTGADACPFNYLYWNFIATHQDRFKYNNRMAMMVRSYQRFSDQKKQQIKNDSDQFLKTYDT